MISLCTSQLPSIKLEPFFLIVSFLSQCFCSFPFTCPLFPTNFSSFLSFQQLPSTNSQPQHLPLLFEFLLVCSLILVCLLSKLSNTIEIDVTRALNKPPIFWWFASLWSPWWLVLYNKGNNSCSTHHGFDNHPMV